MAGFGKMMKQAQMMQEKLKEIKVEGSSGGGVVRIVLSGDRKLSSIKIDPSVVNSDEVEMLEDLLQAAFQQASEELEKKYMEQMSGIMPGLSGLGL